MHLKNKLLVIHTSKTNTIVSYLTKVIRLRDQMVAIGTKVEDKELLSIVLSLKTTVHLCPKIHIKKIWFKSIGF